MTTVSTFTNKTDEMQCVYLNRIRESPINREVITDRAVRYANRRPVPTFERKRSTDFQKCFWKRYGLASLIILHDNGIWTRADSQTGAPLAASPFSAISSAFAGNTARCRSVRRTTTVQLEAAVLDFPLGCQLTVIGLELLPAYNRRRAVGAKQRGRL
jgi:hypothetical protein